jgi:2-polyprenyl-3-methyl-5-hydroxy-6-metoxy-1,4-benzoquinol methylase
MSFILKSGVRVKKPENLNVFKSVVNSSPLGEFDANVFWKEHDSTLAQDGTPNDITLSHDLYRGMPSWFNAYYAHFQRRAIMQLLKKCHLRPDIRSLDIGCGTGRWSGLMLEMGWRPFGVDLGEQALRYGARRWRGALFSCHRLPHLAFAGESFDLAVSVTVVQHIPREEQLGVLREINRVVKPGGYLVICESIDIGDPSAHVFGNTLDGWLEMVCDAGFHLVAQSACEYMPQVRIFQWARSLWQGKARGSLPQTNVSQVAQLLRRHPFLAVAVRLVIVASYPFEHLISWTCPPRWARLACLLLRKC